MSAAASISRSSSSRGARGCRVVHRERARAPCAAVKKIGVDQQARNPNRLRDVAIVLPERIGQHVGDDHRARRGTWPSRRSRPWARSSGRRIASNVVGRQDWAPRHARTVFPSSSSSRTVHEHAVGLALDEADQAVQHGRQRSAGRRSSRAPDAAPARNASSRRRSVMSREITSNWTTAPSIGDRRHHGIPPLRDA